MTFGPSCPWPIEMMVSMASSTPVFEISPAFEPLKFFRPVRPPPQSPNLNDYCRRASSTKWPSRQITANSGEQCRNRSGWSHLHGGSVRTSGGVFNNYGAPQCSSVNQVIPWIIYFPPDARRVPPEQLELRALRLLQDKSCMTRAAGLSRKR